MVDGLVKHKAQDTHAIGHGHPNVPFLFKKLVKFHPLEKERETIDIQKILQLHYRLVSTTQKQQAISAQGKINYTQYALSFYKYVYCTNSSIKPRKSKNTWKLNPNFFSKKLWPHTAYAGGKTCVTPYESLLAAPCAWAYDNYDDLT